MTVGYLKESISAVILSYSQLFFVSFEIVARFENELKSSFYRRLKVEERTSVLFQCQNLIDYMLSFFILNAQKLNNQFAPTVFRTIVFVNSEENWDLCVVGVLISRR